MPSRGLTNSDNRLNDERKPKVSVLTRHLEDENDDNISITELVIIGCYENVNI